MMLLTGPTGHSNEHEVLNGLSNAEEGLLAALLEKKKRTNLGEGNLASSVGIDTLKKECMGFLDKAGESYSSSPKSKETDEAALGESAREFEAAENNAWDTARLALLKNTSAKDAFVAGFGACARNSSIEKGREDDDKKILDDNADEVENLQKQVKSLQKQKLAAETLMANKTNNIKQLQKTLENAKTKTGENAKTKTLPNSNAAALEQKPIWSDAVKSWYIPTKDNSEIPLFGTINGQGLAKTCKQTDPLWDRADAGMIEDQFNKDGPGKLSDYGKIALMELQWMKKAPNDNCKFWARGAISNLKSKANFIHLAQTLAGLGNRMVRFMAPSKEVKLMSK